MWRILKESVRLYLSHWRPLTLVLLQPILLMVLGVYGCLALSQLFINQLITEHSAFAFENLPLVLVILLVIIGATITVFCLGFWRYMVCMASLNLNAHNVSQGLPLDIPAAYTHIANEKKNAYQLLLLAYCLLALLPAIPLMLLTMTGSLIGLPPWNVLLFFAGLALSALLGFAWLVLSVFLSLIFQITAFEPASFNPLPVLLRSIRMVWRRFFATLGLQLVLFLLTCYLLPGPVVWVARQLSISLPLDRFHAWLLALLIEGLSPPTGSMAEAIPLYETVYQQILTHAGEIAQGLSDSMLALIITALLLPLGTFAFTLLYREIEERHSS